MTAADSWRGRLAARVRAVGARSEGHFASLDALRAAAITLVFVNHAAGEFERSGVGALPHAVVRVLTTGWAGVDLFFVLSGFLIGRQLWSELRATGRIDVPAFWLRRGFRIWPLYFAFVIAMALWHADQPLHDALPDALFYSNYVQGQVSGGWSLSTEEQFYLAVPLLLLALVSRLGARGAAVAIVALLVAMPLSRWLTLRAAGWPALDQHAITAAIYTPIHTHADGLLVGLLLSWAWVHGGLRTLTLRDARVRAALAGVAVLAVALRVAQNDLFSFLSLALVFGAAVAIGLLGGPHVQRACRPRPFAVVARLSFGMYLNHELLLVALGPSLFRALAPLGVPGAFVGGAAIAYGASAAIATVTNVLIEQPGLEWRDRWLRSRPAAAQHGPPDAPPAARAAEVGPVAIRAAEVGPSQAHLYSAGSPGRPDP
jgi:peptidoglycan/LPS O-acetylase OafA/YrhL